MWKQQRSFKNLYNLKQDDNTQQSDKYLTINDKYILFITHFLTQPGNRRNCVTKNEMYKEELTGPKICGNTFENCWNTNWRSHRAMVANDERWSQKLGGLCNLFEKKYWTREGQRGIRQWLEIEQYSWETYYKIWVPHRKSEEEIISILTEHFDTLTLDASCVQNITTIQGLEMLLQREDLLDQHRNTKNHDKSLWTE